MALGDYPIDLGNRVVNLADEARVELGRALGLFAPMHSPHEGKAVIEEELDELWQHVKANTGGGAEARAEAIQLAAMALRYALDCCDLA
jgi:hypothetical protein